MSDDADDLNAELRRAMASLDRRVPAGYFEALPGRTLARLDDPDIGAGIGPDIGAGIGPDIGPDAAGPGADPGVDRDSGGDSDLDRARAARAARAAPRVGRWQRAMIAAGLGVAAAAGAVLFLTLGDRGGSRANDARAPSAVAAPGAARVQSARDSEEAVVVLDRAHDHRAMTISAGSSAPAANVTAATASAGSASVEGAAVAGGAERPRPPPGGETAGSAADRQRLLERERQRVRELEVALAKPDTGPVAPSAPAVAPTAPASAPSAAGARAPGTSPASPTVEGDLTAGPGGGGTVGTKSADINGTTGNIKRAGALSRADFERGMTAVAGKARACFAGTRGTAAVRLLVAPTGRVARVTVSGVFAGTPVGACVERAAASATFPAWDGRPQLLDYSYLLSD